MGKNRWVIIVAVLLLMLVEIIGCAPKTTPTPPPNAPPLPAPSGGITAEDPAPIINQMNQSADNINVQVKANQIPQAKQASSNLMALDERLAPHFTDTMFQEKLHNAVLTLNDEVNKPTPNSAEVDKKVQAVKGLLQQAPAKIMKM